MKTNINLLLIIVILCGACTKAPWESYQPPLDPNAQIPDPDPEPEEPGEPGEPEEQTSLKIISIGINNRNADYVSLVQLIKEEKADLVVLREVDKNNKRTGIDINQAEIIARDVDMQYVFAPQLDNYQEGQFGLAVLSRLPIEESWITKLPVGPVLKGDERPLAYLKVNFNEDIDIAFFGLHLDDGSNKNRRIENRPIQAKALLDYIKDIDIPTIIAGNFFFQNEGDDALPSIYLDELTSPCMPCVPTVNMHSMDFIGDHVLYKNMLADQLLDYRIGNELSGRKPAIAEFKLIDL